MDKTLNEQIAELVPQMGKLVNEKLPKVFAEHKTTAELVSDIESGEFRNTVRESLTYLPGH